MPACLLPKAELSSERNAGGASAGTKNGNSAGLGGRRQGDGGSGTAPRAGAGSSLGDAPNVSGAAGEGGSPGDGSDELGGMGPSPTAGEGGAAESTGGRGTSDGGTSGTAGSAALGGAAGVPATGGATHGSAGNSGLGGVPGASGTGGSGGTLPVGTIQCGAGSCRVTGLNECCFREFDATAVCQARESNSCAIENISGGGQTSWWRTALRCNTSQDCPAAEICCYEQAYTSSQTICVQAADCVDMPGPRYSTARTPTCDPAAPDGCPTGSCQSGSTSWLPSHIGLCSDEP